jgi:hypothetical protein
MSRISAPYSQFYDKDGSPLEDGYIYIGTEGFNPENSPIPVYWDEARLILAPQPLRTVNGLITRSGSPSNVYVGSSYSIIVRDKNRALVSQERYAESDVLSDLSASNGASFVGFSAAGTGARSRTVMDRLREHISAKDFVTMDGATDDAAGWANLLAALPASNFVLTIPAGVSIVNESAVNGIKFANKSNFAILAEGATIKVKNGEPVRGNHEILYFENCTDFVVSGLTVDANRATRTPAEVGAHSIVIANGCARGTFRDCVSKNAVVDCWIVYTTGIASTRPTDIVMDNCVGDNGWRQGLSIINSIRFTVLGGRYTNTTGSMPQCGIDIEPDAGVLNNDDTIIDGADLRGNAGFGLQIGGPTDKNNRVIVRNITGANNAEGLILAGAANGLTLTNIECGPHSTATRAIIDCGSSVKQLEIDGVRFRGITAGPSKSCIYVHNSITGRPRLKNISDIGSTSPVLSIWKGSYVTNLSSDGCTTDAVVINSGTDTVIDGFDISSVTGRSVYNAASGTTLRNGNIINSASTTGAIQFDTGSTSCNVDGVSITYTGALPSGAVGVYWATTPLRFTDVAMRVNGADATPAQLTTFAAGVSGAKIFDCIPNPLSITQTIDPPSITGSGSVTGTVTITGAAFGDLVFAAPGVDLNGETLTVSVSSSNTVRWTIARANSGAFDLGSSSWRFWLEKR